MTRHLGVNALEIPVEMEPGVEPNVEPQAGSRLLSKILSPAIRLWLRSQVESAALLEFQVLGRDRQLLQGQIPAVQVNAKQVVYQGLHLSQAQLKASQIQINLSQVVQGKPLRLLQVVPVVGQICLTQADLTASSESGLLHQGLTELLKMLLQSLEAPALAELAQATLQYPSLVLGQGQFRLTAELVAPTLNPTAPTRWHLTLQAALRLIEPTRLQLEELTLEIGRLCQPVSKLSLQPIEIDLGREVNLQQIEITPAQVICIGQINVVPA
jgi:hypothetical protein